ncbi:prolyl oligopeptidase family serine peptidase [Aeoliella mucimassa]|uniref:prolyl oligopeptidase n=1 Tax=Aeoliella mucimassa TaxID=2527972 RepID=A0A518AMP3_9BACT|nr:prolyl oligopeptidase family serine peptidase [Aeoliella mucimassa]QDU55976.1 Prolyl endopeptidase [Aeoliella mucimassa]
MFKRLQNGRSPVSVTMSLWIGLVVVVISMPNSAPAGDYPATRRVDHTDDYHGTTVPDPYRWLESDVRESQEVADWVESQSEFARQYLDTIPAREIFAKRLEKLYNFERYSAPRRKGGRFFYSKNDGLQNQSVLYLAESDTDPGRVLIDPNTWSEDGTVALSSFSVSEDGELMAIAKSSSGSDWKTIQVMEIESGKMRDDLIEWVRFGGMDWDRHGTGFYYARYPKPGEGEKFQSVALNQKIYYHKLGTPQAEDKLVYERPDHPDWSFGVSVTEEGDWLVLSIGSGTDPQNQVWVKSLAAEDADWIPLVDHFENEYALLANRGSLLYFLTDKEAPQKRIVAIDAAKPTEMMEIVPQQEATLVDADIVGGRLIAQYLKDVHAEVEMFDYNGKSLGQVELPGIGSAGGFHGEEDENETYFSFTNTVTPTSIYKLDIPTGKVEVLRRPGIDFDSDQYVVEQVFYPSKDGTKIPMTISHRKGLKLDGTNPTLLYAYGGFNISITPSFSVDYAAWMEQGGVVAIANLRGGGEYGEDWHQAGKLGNKQNVFDDFIAAAEWLIANKYTASERLAIRGGSNGGLLVGAVMTQRPELFGACLPAVGVHDMLRFHKFTAGQFWRSEYGSSDEAEDFKFLYAYSPYHNVEPGTSYPATMVTTADTDDRVVPMHSFKFAAALQNAQAGEAPILLRVELKAGHGAGTPISKHIEQAADMWAFLSKVFDMQVEAK